MNEPSTQWLSESEQRAWQALVALMARLPAAMDTQLRRDAHLTLYEYCVLVVLNRADARTAKMKDLALWTDGSLSRLSQVVTRLEGRGLVRRVASPTDGRTTLCVLTDEGDDTLTAAAPAHVEHVQDVVFRQLTGQQVSQLEQIAQRIVHGVISDEAQR